ncbi:MAG: Ig-like domain-containing protein [Pseudomonadales bacterium]|nr:Ig-like domain-containing protein [Pseudomonadales bacterium]
MLLKKNTKILFLVFLFITALLALIWKLKSSDTISETEYIHYTATKEAITFKIQSDIKGFQIDSDSSNQTFFDEILSQPGFPVDLSSLRVLGGNQFVNPKLIMFEFHDIVSLNQEEQSSLIFPFQFNNSIMQGYKNSYDYNTEILTYYIYLDKQYLQNLKNEGVASLRIIFHYNIIRPLYLSSIITEDLTVFGKIQTFVDQKIRNNESLFKFKFETNILSFRILENIFPRVYAADYCDGGYVCEYKGYINCTCDLGGAPCFNPPNGDCGPGLLGKCNNCASTSCFGTKHLNCNASEPDACSDEGLSCPNDTDYCNPPVSESCSWNPPPAGTPTPTPTPTPTASPGMEWCYSCSQPNGGFCQNLGQVAQGTCATNCDACNSEPTPTATPTADPSCNISLTPVTSSQVATGYTVELNAITSNVQNGSISHVTFSSLNSSIATVSPDFDDSSPYTTLVTGDYPGTTTITANGYMGGSSRCSSTVNITVVATAEDEAPQCPSFQVTSPTVNTGGIAQYIAEITDDGINILPDHSFESGTVSYWPTLNNINEWYAVNSGAFSSPGIDGIFYAKLSRANNSDPHVATGWMQTGENLTDQEYTLTFLGKSHQYPKLVQYILIQRYPYLGDWTDTGVFIIDPIFYPDSWTRFKYNLTFPNPNNGSHTTRIRVVLRPPQDDSPVYYDSVKLFKTNTAGVDEDTVKFYYMPATYDPCDPANWTELGAGTRISNTDFYQILWDTSGMSEGDYYVIVNVSDIQGNLTSGNPSNCGELGVTYIDACGSTQSIVACTPSCGGTECGDTGATPNQVTNVRINGQDPNSNLDLTLDDNLTVTWDDPGTPDPNSTIDYYQINVWDKDRGPNRPDPCNTSSDCFNYQTANKVETYTITTPSHIYDNDLYVAVSAVNAIPCTPASGPWSDKSGYTLVAQVRGNFYIDPSPSLIGGNCLGDDTDPIDFSNYPGSSVYGSIGDQATTLTDSYTRLNVPYAPSSQWNDYGFTTSLEIDNSANPANILICSCPVGNNPLICTHTDSISPNLNEHFYVTTVNLSNGPWWQVVGGNAYGADSFITNIPQTCYDVNNTAICKPDAVTMNLDSDTNSAGIPMSGNAVSTNGYNSERGANDPKAENTTHENLIKENYNFFASEVDLGAATAISGTINSIPSDPGAESDTEIYYSNSDLSIDFSTTQNVVSSRNIVIFVNGNLSLTSNQDTRMLTVEPGGFIAFIVSGDINFDANIGNTNETNLDTNVEGVFVADGSINVKGYSDDPINDDTLKDNKFVGAGTFVGWSGINLTRDYENTNDITDKQLNNLNPIETFIFRPDFNINVPTIMMKPSIVWQEVN